MNELSAALREASVAAPDLADAAVVAPSLKSGANSRFFAKTGVSAVRGCMAALDRVSPHLAAQVGYRFISVPPRFRPKPEEDAARTKAQEWRIAFGRRWLHCYGWGRGPVVLLAHSWGGRGTQFSPWIGPLRDAGFRPVAFDYPAHGRSSGRDTDMIEMAEAIAAVSETCGPVHAVIGHSLGAATSLLAMRDFGLRTGIFVSISCLSHFIWIVDFAGDYLDLSPGLRLRMRNLLVERHRGRFAWESLSTAEILGSTPMSALLVHDRDDREVPIAHALELRDAARQATLMTTSKLGHRRILKDPEVIDAALAFIASRPLAAAPAGLAATPAALSPVN